MSAPRVLILTCGHERWAPIGWVKGTEVRCAECADPAANMRYLDALKAAPLRPVRAVKGAW